MKFSSAPACCGDKHVQLETDIVMGKQAGMWAAVTLTGMTRQEDLHPSEYAPDLVVENLGGLLVLTQ